MPYLHSLPLQPLALALAVKETLTETLAVAVAVAAAAAAVAAAAFAVAVAACWITNPITAAPIASPVFCLLSIVVLTLLVISVSCSDHQ